jgi:hypothetical protein
MVFIGGRCSFSMAAFPWGSILSVVVFTALAAVTIPAAAQSPTSYPWCMKGARGGTSCYFNSYQDCMAAVSGLGGWCMRNPYYRGAGRQ